MSHSDSQGFSPQAVVLYSRGLPVYVFCCLFQLRKTSANMPIVLISDADPKLDFVTWIDARDYTGAYERFRRLYVHLSTNEDWFERVCFYRWFVIRDWMVRAGVERCMHIDTDVLMFVDANCVSVPVPAGGIGIGSSVDGSFSPHVLMINGVSALSRFCDFCCEMYEEPEKLEILKKFYNRKRAADEAGGVCDMYAFGWITGWRGTAEQIIPRVELNSPEVLGVAWDDCISNDRTATVKKFWSMKDGVKVVQRGRGNTRSFVTSDGKVIPVAAIHCQGAHKSLMFGLMDNWDSAFLARYVPLATANWCRNKVLLFCRWVVWVLRLPRRVIRKVLKVLSFLWQ